MTVAVPRTPPQASLHHPTALGEFFSWFATDEDCRDYLRWLRWPDGFGCPECGGEGWEMSDGRHECDQCHLRTSVTAGTVFDDARTALTGWFHAAWLFATNQAGVSVTGLKCKPGRRSYQTARPRERPDGRSAPRDRPGKALVIRDPPGLCWLGLPDLLPGRVQLSWQSPA